jgi:hypothetical protein
MEDTEASREEKEATVNTRQEQKKKPHATQEKMEATINFIWSEMEKIFKLQVEDILILVN